MYLTCQSNPFLPKLPPCPPFKVPYLSKHHLCFSALPINHISPAFSLFPFSPSPSHFNCPSTPLAPSLCSLTLRGCSFLYIIVLLLNYSIYKRQSILPYLTLRPTSLSRSLATAKSYFSSTLANTLKLPATTHMTNKILVVVNATGRQAASLARVASAVG